MRSCEGGRVFSRRYHTYARSVHEAFVILTIFAFLERITSDTTERALLRTSKFILNILQQIKVKPTKEFCGGSSVDLNQKKYFICHLLSEQHLVILAFYGVF